MSYKSRQVFTSSNLMARIKSILEDSTISEKDNEKILNVVCKAVNELKTTSDEFKFITPEIYDRKMDI